MQVQYQLYEWGLNCLKQMEMHAVDHQCLSLAFYITDIEQLKKYIQLTLLTTTKYTRIVCILFDSCKQSSSD